MLRCIGTGTLGQHGSNRHEFGFDPCELLLDALLPVRAAYVRLRAVLVRGVWHGHQ